MITIDFRYFPVGPGDRVLDVGCGGGRHTFEAYRRGADVTALDTDGAQLADVEAMAEAMRQAGEAGPGAQGGSVTTVRADATALPFPDGSFDRVVAAEVLEHLPNDAGALTEIARVVRPGGTVAVTVPSYGPEKLCWMLSDAYHANEGGHVRIYRRAELVQLLRTSGLQVLGMHHAHALHAPYWWLKCLVGVDRDPAAVRAYHRMLVWDMTAAPRLTRTAERLLDPVLGKSLVLYARKPPARGGQRRPATTAAAHAG